MTEATSNTLLAIKCRYCAEGSMIVDYVAHIFE